MSQTATKKPPALKRLRGMLVAAFAAAEAVAETGAQGLRDMGRVMAELRARHAGQMDFGAVGPMVKDRLMK